MSGDIIDVHFREVDKYGYTISIAVDIEIDMEVVIYLYNPGHDGGENKIINLFL